MYREILEEELTVDKGTGYLYFCDKQHPLATGGAYRVLLHRHLASIYNSRWLSSNEWVHHVNHNKLDNSKENLHILSSSEHAKLHCIEKGFNLKHKVQCKYCGKEFETLEGVFCSPACNNTNNIKDKTLTKELLDELIPKYTWVALGKMFGYSDTGIKKRAKSLGCIIPKRC